MKIPFNSLRFKIVLMVFLVLLAASAAVIVTVISSYRNDMLSSSKRILNANSLMLEAIIRNIMLRGEAPIVVKTMSSVRSIEGYKDLVIYRSDGKAAFSDYKTLDSVNLQLGEDQFERTPRVEARFIDNPSFREVVRTRAPIQSENYRTREMEYLFPINFSADCRVCHDPANPVRGVVDFKVSLDPLYRQITRIVIGSPVFFFVVFLLLGILILVFINRLVIRPLLEIGNAVTEVGKGNLDLIIPVRSRDEIGGLTERINTMTRGLKERFILSRYVSRSTEQQIRTGGDVSPLRKHLTVVFSDIRSFTSFSERHDPEEVVVILNRYLSVQADIIEKHGGDVDNFIGDAIMGVFPDPYKAVLAAHEMLSAVAGLATEGGTGLHVGAGLASGDVITGDIGSLNRKKHTVIGDTVNLASRLASLAKPDMILVSESVNTLLAGQIESELVPDQKIKGKSGMINYYIVHSIR